MIRRRNYSTAAGEVARSRVSHLIRAGLVRKDMSSGLQKHVPTFPWIDNCLMVTKRNFLGNGSNVTVTGRSRNGSVAKGLGYGVGKQPSMPLIESWKEMDVKKIMMVMIMIMMNGDANTESNFSRFCLHSTTSVKRERLQINMNVKDIFLKKKQT